MCKRNEKIESFQEYKLRLTLLANDNLYEKLIEECITMKKLIKKQKYMDIECIKEYVSYSDYVLARSTKILYGNKKLNRVIEYIQHAIKYNHSESEYYKRIWLLAVYYTMTNKIEKAIRIYEDCITYYSEQKNNILLASVIHNKAILEYDKFEYDTDKKNEVKIEMEKAISILESLSEEEIVSGGYKKDNLLNEAYSDMFRIYNYHYTLYGSELIYRKMMNTLHKIPDIKIQKSLSQQLLSCCKTA